MLLPCGDSDQAGDLGSLTSVLWNKLKYIFYVIAHLSSGEQCLALCFLPTCIQTPASSYLRRGHNLGISKRPHNILEYQSDLMYYLTKVTVPLRASYFLPD